MPPGVASNVAAAEAADVTDDGGSWSSSHDQYKMLSANWLMRGAVVPPAAAPGVHIPGVTCRLFNLQQECVLLKTRYFGVVRQRPKVGRCSLKPADT
jgi:hypothetical protein